MAALSRRADPPTPNHPPPVRPQWTAQGQPIYAVRACLLLVVCASRITVSTAARNHLPHFTARFLTKYPAQKLCESVASSDKQKIITKKNWSQWEVLPQSLWDLVALKTPQTCVDPTAFLVTNATLHSAPLRRQISNINVNNHIECLFYLYLIRWSNF